VTIGRFIPKRNVRCKCSSIVAGRDQSRRNPAQREHSLTEGRPRYNCGFGLREKAGFPAQTHRSRGLGSSPRNAKRNPSAGQFTAARVVPGAFILKTRRGGGENDERSETAFDEGSERWKKTEPKIQTLERRDLRSSLSWLAVPPQAALGWLVSCARQSAALLFRARPFWRTKKTGETNRAARAAVGADATTGQPASPRRAGGATGGPAPAGTPEAQARGQRAEHDAPRPSGAPCQARRPAGRGVGGVVKQPP